MLFILTLLSCAAEQPAAADMPPFPDGEDIHADEVPAPDPLRAADIAHMENADSPSPEEIIDAEVVHIGSAGDGDAVFDEIVATDDALLSEILTTIPTEDRVWVELAVKNTVALLAENGRLNPGEGHIPGRAEKIILIVLGLVGYITSIVVRMRTAAPARLPDQQIEAIKAPLHGQIKGIEDRLRALEQDGEERAVLARTIRQKDERNALLAEAYSGLQKQYAEATADRTPAGLDTARTIGEEIERTRKAGQDFIAG